MIVINLFGQPGAGKSTTAATIFAYFKNRGYNFELITEYAKEMVYSKRQAEMINQVYLLAKQYKRMKDIQTYEKVPVVINDSPIKLCNIYAANQPYAPELIQLAGKLTEEFENINILIKRTKKYNPSGRIQTEEQSDALGEAIAKLEDFDFVITGDESGQRSLCEALESRFKNMDFAPKI